MTSHLYFSQVDLLAKLRRTAVLAPAVLLVLGHALETHASETKALKASPKIVKKELTITCTVTPQSKNGVALAQGGSVRGYALYLKDGKPIFTVRQNGKIYSATSKLAPKGRFVLQAHLAKDGKMSLAVDGKVVARSKAPGMFAVQPKDELSVSKDSFSAVGDYQAPNPLKGKVENVKIDTK